LTCFQSNKVYADYIVFSILLIIVSPIFYWLWFFKIGMWSSHRLILLSFTMSQWLS